jgi:PD-(D/E)XK nuclease superfamily
MLSLRPAYDLTHRYTENGRWHQCGSYGLRPGVTTVLSRTLPQERAEFFQSWEARVGAAEAERVRNRATSQGTWLHKRIEDHLSDRHFCPPSDIELDEMQLANVEKMWGRMIPILGEIELVYGLELPAFWAGPEPEEGHLSWGYAGSIDCIAQIHGQTVVVDWKTSSSTPKPESWLADYKLQAAAYANAAARTYPDLPPITMAAIVIVAPKGSPQILELDRLELLQAEEEFGRRLEQFYAQLPQPEADLLAAS